LLIPFFLSAQFVDSSRADYKAYYYESGELASEGYVEDGKPNGYWITYYPNQLRKSEGNRKDFLLDGPWKFYDEKGNLKQIISYKEGKKDSISKVFESCHLLELSYFKEGLQIGMQRIYYPDSSNALIKAEIPYQDGVKDGIAKFYAKDGRLIELVTYKKGFVASREKINQIDEEGRKQGLWKEYYPNGRLKTEKRYKNDELNGYIKEYTSQGKLEGAKLFLEGEQQSEEENEADFEIRYTYYDDGSVKSTTTYNLAGEKDGVAQFYDREGEVINAEIWKNNYLIAKGIIDRSGVRRGDWETYYLDGTLKSKGSYRGGEKYGKWVYYFSSGEVEQEGFYDKAGRFTGEWTWYYENGNVLRTEEFIRGLEDGMLVEYALDSTVITKGEFLEGEKEGEWYYKLNDHQEIGKYLYGQRNGYWEHQYPNGKVSFKGLYEGGKPHGDHKYYNKKGVLIRKEAYTFGVKDGKWKWYDDNGVEYLSITYKNGEEKKVNGERFKLESN
jgi:antitoxin component YwqK of YwqJK toxin-antitoxin module